MTAAKYTSSEPGEGGGKKIQVEGITSTKAWSQGAYQGALRNWVWNAKDEERDRASGWPRRLQSELQTALGP